MRLRCIHGTPLWNDCAAPTLAASLTFCGAIMGRKVRDSWDNRTNLYTMSVAASSAGKNHARKQIKRLIAAAGIDNLLGGEDVTSDSAIGKRLEAQPTTFFLWDEIGHMMQSIRSNGSNPHLAKVLPTLMKLYSASGEVYIGKEYATGERRSIDQPCCCLYGTTTPDKLADGISPAEIKDGFLGRVLVFISDENPRKDFQRAALATTVPESLVQRVRRWWARDFTPAAHGDPGSIGAASQAVQIEVSTTDAAQAHFLALESFADAQVEHTLHKTKGIDRLWGKAGENARKIALIVACGESESAPRIEERHASYACDLVSHIISQLAHLVVRHVAESVFEKDKQYLLRIIRGEGPKGITRRDLTRRTQKFDSRQRESYLRDLAVADEIVIRDDERPNRIYRYPFRAF